MPVLAAFMLPHPPIILPEVGRGEEKKIKETSDAYMEVARRVAKLRPDTVIITSPHNVMYADYFNIAGGSRAKGDMSRFGAYQVRVSAEYDTELTARITKAAEAAGFPAGTEGGRGYKDLDHGTLIPLYFIQKEYTDFKVLRTGLSGLSLADHYRFGLLIRDAVESLGRRAVVIASGDLSHKLKKDGPYGLDPMGPVYDERIMDVMSRGAFGELFDFDEALLESAAECGHRSFVIMAGILDRLGVHAEKLSHQGTFGVGYGICAFDVTGPDPDRDFLDKYLAEEKARLKKQQEKEDPYVRLARLALESYIRNGDRVKVPQDIPEDFLSGLSEEERKGLFGTAAGAFVSLHKEGQLRGCIGTISATRKNVAEEICENAVSASTRDPRFMPVSIPELDSLEYSVDILGEAEPIDSEDQLDPKKYGVIVTKGHRRGLLLPDLEGIDTAREQVIIARHKAGIGKDETGVKLERFEVIRHK